MIFVITRPRSDPWPNTRQPAHAGEYLAVRLKNFAYFGKITTILLRTSQLGGKFNKE